MVFGAHRIKSRKFPPILVGGCGWPCNHMRINNLPANVVHGAM